MKPIQLDDWSGPLAPRGLTMATAWAVAALGVAVMLVQIGVFIGAATADCQQVAQR